MASMDVCSEHHQGEIEGGPEEEDPAEATLTTEVIDQDGETVNLERSRNVVPIDPNVDTCWRKFMRIMRAFWATRFTEDVEGNRDLYVITTIRELIIYLIFLVVLVIVTGVEVGQTQFYYAERLSNEFIGAKINEDGTTFKSMSSINEVWQFLEGPLLDGMYQTKWYNGNNRSREEKHLILAQSKLLGIARIRQLRVKNDSCIIPEDFRKVIRKCYGAYTLNNEETRPFGRMKGPGWVYTPAALTDTYTYEALRYTYRPGGYIVDLSSNRTGSERLLQHLKHYLWVRQSTRAMFVDFSIYNANVNIFCIVKLIMEFPPTGGVVTSNMFSAVKLLRYVSKFDQFVMAAEIIYCLFIIYYIIEEAIEIKKHRLKYLSSMWNIIDISVIIISLVCVAFHTYRLITVSDKLDLLLSNENAFPDFDSIRYSQSLFNKGTSIMVFLCIIKIFKYISFNKTMTQLSTTLAGCARDLAGFAIMFFIVFFAFAQLGYLLFGTQVKEFREFKHSIFTLFRIILGDFNFHDMENAHRVLGPIFFLLYVFFVFFVLINMFLAIINDTYSGVKDSLSKQKNEIEMGDFFREKAFGLLRMMKFKKTDAIKINEILAEISIPGKPLDFETFRQEMMNRGFSSFEIQSVFASYDTDSDLKLDLDEQGQLRRDMANYTGVMVSRGRGSIVSESDGTPMPREGLDRRRPDSASDVVTPHDLGRLTDRLEAMEQSVRCILPKIDDLMDNLGITAADVEAAQSAGGGAQEDGLSWKKMN